MHDRDDPDWLFLLLRALRELDSRRSSEWRTSGEDDLLKQRSAPLLDSLARLLVSEERHQTVAVAFKPSIQQRQAPTFFVAQYSSSEDPQKLKNYLLFLASQLRKVREVMLSSHDAPSSPEPGIEYGPLHAAQQTGEIVALNHSWKKIKRRFTKDDRYKTFLSLVADVLEGEPADQRTGCDDMERRTLKALQGCPAADRECLSHVGEGIAYIRDVLFSQIGGRRDGKEGEYKLAVEDRRLLTRLRLEHHVMIPLIDRSQRLWSLCTDYIRGRLF